MSIFTANNKFLTSDSNMFVTKWKPNMIDDIIFWGYANSRNINQDVDGVYYWKDNSGKMNHAYQPYTNRPHYVREMLNGYPVLYFNNNDNIKFEVNINYFTIISVVKVLDSDYLYSFGTDNNDGFYLNGDDNSILVEKTNHLSQKSNGSDWFSGDWEIITHKYDGFHNGHTLFINNNYVWLNDYYYDEDPGDLDLFETFRIGSNYDSVYGMKGFIAEFLIYNRSLTEFETTQVHEYLNNKYQIY